MAKHLIASVRAGGDHRVGLHLVHQVLKAGGPGGRRVCRKPIVLRAVHDLNAVWAELRVIEGQDVDRIAEIAGERQRLQGQLLARLDQDEDAHPATPISRMISTTRGAASGPLPRISACLPWPGGTTRRTFSSLDSGRVTGFVSTGLFFARSFAGTDG